MASEEVNSDYPMIVPETGYMSHAERREVGPELLYRFEGGCTSIADRPEAMTIGDCVGVFQHQRRVTSMRVDDIGWRRIRNQPCQVQHMAEGADLPSESDSIR